MRYSKIKNRVLHKCVSVIIEAAHPERVILFGSRASGNARQDSDYDIIVIKKGIQNERLISSMIYKALFRKKVGIPVEIIAVETEKWEKNKNDLHLIYNVADKEGIVLYG